MVYRFKKGEEYSLMLGKLDEKGDPITWTANVRYKEKDFESETNLNCLVFRSIDDEVTYIVKEDNSVYYTDGWYNKRCECCNITRDWQF